LNLKIKSFLRFSLFLSIGLAILYWLYSSQSTAYQAYCVGNNIAAADCDFLGRLKADFSSIKWFWILMVLICYNISNISRALRWQILLRSAGHPVKFINSFIPIVITYFANSIIPRSGEIARAAYLTKLEDVPMEKALGTIAVGRSLDVLSLLIVIGLGFVLEADMLMEFFHDNNVDPIQIIKEKSWLGFVGLAGLAILGLMFFYREKLRTIKFFQLFEEKLRGFWTGIAAVKNLDKPFLFLFHSVNIWFMYYLMVYLGFFSFEPTELLSATSGLIVFIVGTFGILIPSPGGMGAYQFLVETCLTNMYGIDQLSAFSFANIAFFPIYIFNILAGFVTFMYLSLTGKDKGKADVNPED
jgi:uncharacterized protein (TIRG00374 family)